jgi:CcmD family protein
MSNSVFVVSAFAATWIALLGYLAHLARAMRRSRDLLARARMGGKP